MSKPKFIGIKEVAQALELSSRSIRRKERQLGLDQAKTKNGPRRYVTAAAERILRKHGYDVSFEL